MVRWSVDRGRAARVRARAVPALALAALLTGCGADDGPQLTGAAAEGRQLVADRGCVSCHGADGSGGVAPSWVGLHGTTVELSDGTTVLADRTYLVQSVLDPSSQIVDGYLLRMPPNNLTEAEAEAVAAYIEELG